jgi:hypothetical protein
MRGLPDALPKIVLDDPARARLRAAGGGAEQRALRRRRCRRRVYRL